MARKTNTRSNGEKKFTVKVKNNPDFCGVGAGGIQFANGKAENVNERMAAWFREHEGYEVLEASAGSADTDQGDPE